MACISKKLVYLICGSGLLMKTNGLGTSQIYTGYCIYSLVVLHAKKPMNKLTIILIGLIFVSFTNNESKDCISDLYSMLDKKLNLFVL